MKYRDKRQEPVKAEISYVDEMIKRSQDSPRDVEEK